MHYAPRTVGLLCELVHAPKSVDVASIQRFHGEMLESRTPVYGSFHALPHGVVLANQPAQRGAVSAVEIVPDRIVFREELSGATADDFAERVRAVGERALALRGLDRVTQQGVVVRTLVNPRHYADSRAFLREGLLGLAGETAAFGREPALYGVSFAFPPTEAEPSQFTLRADTLPADPRSILLQNQGVFAGTAAADGMEALGRNVLATYDFLVTRALDFLSQFDVRLET